MASASVELQDLILARLKGWPALTAILGGRVYDGPPSKPTFPYISLGPSDVVPMDADCFHDREETIQIDVWHRDQGRRWQCKATVDAVKDALHEYAGDLATHALVELRVELARVMDDPDGITVHGVVQVTALIEEA